MIIYDDTVSLVILQRSLDKRLKTRRWIPSKWPIRDNLSFSRRPGDFAEVAKLGGACRVNSHSESTPGLRVLVYYTITDAGPLINGLLEII